MLKIKYHKGFSKIYPVNKENFIKVTKEEYPYSQNGNNYAICPICENPVILLGLYKPISQKASDGTKTIKPHGRHNTVGDVQGLANYIKADYLACPNHKKTDDYIFERHAGDANERDLSIYKTLRENFDIAVSLIRKAVPFYINNNMIESMLRDYLSKEAYMYTEATEYNIPWVLIHAMDHIGLYHRLVRTDSGLCTYLSNYPGIKLDTSKSSGQYAEITNDGRAFIDLDWVVTGIRCHTDKNDIFHNYIKTVIGKPDGRGTYTTLYEEEIEVDPYSFSRLAHSEKAIRDQKLLEMAQKIMPEI